MNIEAEFKRGYATALSSGSHHGQESEAFVAGYRSGWDARNEATLALMDRAGKVLKSGNEEAALALILAGTGKLTEVDAAFAAWMGLGNAAPAPRCT
jgi:hypothetical protein